MPSFNVKSVILWVKVFLRWPLNGKLTFCFWICEPAQWRIRQPNLLRSSISCVNSSED